MKNTAWMIALAVLLSAPAFAEGTHDGKDFMAKKVEKMKEKLSLTDEQAAKIKAIHEDSAAKFEALRKEVNEQVSAVLTPEQREKHEALLKEWKEKRQQKKEDKYGAGEEKPAENVEAAAPVTT